MLRISLIEAGDDSKILRLEGRVVGPWVGEVRRLCAPLLGSTPLTLDMGDVSFIDADGLTLLRELEARRVNLTNCSPFVAEQIKGGLS
jgi:hypothetical protein